MSKWFEVPLTLYKTFAVEVEDNESGDDAIAYAMDEFMSENIECEGATEASELYTPEHMKRLADQILKL